MKVKTACISITIFIAVLIAISILVTLFQKDMPVGDKIALIRVEGPILDSKKTIEEIKEYVKDRSVKAIVVRVDSPGGGVVPSQEIYEEIKKATVVKKVVISMGSLAASGGYYISSPASRIVANPGTTTGSIGVIMQMPNIKGFMDKLGIKSEVIASGKHKDIASPFRGIGKEERQILQSVMDDVHDQFINAIADGRKMPVEAVRKIADGSVFSGRQALKIGLVDELGDLEDAIKAAAKMVGIKGEPNIVTKKERHPVLELLGGRIPEGLLKIIPRSELKFILPYY